MAEVVLVQRRTRDASPDSVIFTHQSNPNIFSLFSASASASASGDRCSFASEHESLVSDISQPLAAHDVTEGSSGPDPNPTKLPAVHGTGRRLTRKAEKATIVPKEGGGLGSESVTEADVHPVGDSARSSFSLAVKDRQDQRFRSNALPLNKPERRRPASLDLNNATTGSSPRLVATMKKPAASSRRLPGTSLFPSPGTPTYRHNSVGFQKGWSSERVLPSHAHSTRRHLASAALLPFNNGRTLPSKWEDAERWIFSPFSGGGGLRPPALPPPKRRPKSKSGPLGAPGTAGYYSMYSPVMPMFEGGNGGSYTANSPFSSTTVMATDGMGVLFGGRGGCDFSAHDDEPHCIARSTSMHGCTKLLGQSSLPGSTDEKHDDIKDADVPDTYVVSRRDMATQMTPDGSTHTSPQRRLSFSCLNPSAIPVEESLHSSGVEVRDVQVDDRVTMTRWSKKNRRRTPRRNSGNADGLENRAHAQCCAWNLPETEKDISRLEKEEAKITAWERLQKAKAEAAIQKLEMELEKKRTSSMDKILKKLRSAQKRAQEMKRLLLTNQTCEVAQTSHKHLSFSRTRYTGSLSGCFNCHAF